MQYETLIPLALQSAIVPAAPKSQSSGCAVTTKTRSISLSFNGSIIGKVTAAICLIVPTDRLTNMSELIEGLNPQQIAAVKHEGSPLLVVAGAGSGKTRVLTRRIAYLLAQRNVAPYEVLAITFTNKAAGEMKERVAQLVGDRAKAMWVSTFHSACVRILRKEASLLGYTNSFTIYDQSDSLRLITLVMRDLNLDAKRYAPRAVAALISQAKNELMGPADYLNQG